MRKVWTRVNWFENGNGFIQILIQASKHQSINCELLTIIDIVDNRQNSSVIFSFCKMKPLKSVGDGKQLEDKYHCGSFSWLITKNKLWKRFGQKLRNCGMLRSTCPCGVKQVSNGDCLECFSLVGTINVLCLGKPSYAMMELNRVSVLIIVEWPTKIFFSWYNVLFLVKKIYTKRLLLLAPTCHSFDCIPPQKSSTDHLLWIYLGNALNIINRGNWALLKASEHLEQYFCRQANMQTCKVFSW